MTKPGAIKKEGKEEILRSFVETSRKVLRGESEEAGLEQSRELIEKMVGFGRITKDQGGMLEKQLVEKMRTSKALFETEVSNIIKEMTKRLETIASKELTELESRLQVLESRLGTATPGTTPRVQP